MQKKSIVSFLRLIHFLIVLYLISGIIYIYYCAFTNTSNLLLVVFLISLTLEGIIIFVNRGKCPFGYFQKKFGDDVAFFDLILPKKYAKNAVKFCAIITLIGMALIVIL